MNRLWEDGWKDRYYKNKFDVDADDQEFRHNVVSGYIIITIYKDHRISTQSSAISMDYLD